MSGAPTDPRDARHLSLHHWGSDGVARLRDAHLLILGVGGTGCTAAAALAAAGPAHLTLADFDRIDTSNLARQWLYTPADVGQDKAVVAATRLSAQHPDVRLDAVTERLHGTALTEAVGHADVVLDCTDNFASRFALNAACVAQQTPLVTGSAVRWEGQVAVFDSRAASSPCYRCLYSDDDESLDDCQGVGVAGPLPGAIGALMAVEAMKVLTHQHQPGVLHAYDALAGEWRRVSIPKRIDCPVCATQR